MSWLRKRSKVPESGPVKNFTLFRKLALALLKQHPRQDSIARKRKTAALDPNSLAEALPGRTKLEEVRCVRPDRFLLVSSDSAAALPSAARPVNAEISRPPPGHVRFLQQVCGFSMAVPRVGQQLTALARFPDRTPPLQANPTAPAETQIAHVSPLVLSKCETTSKDSAARTVQGARCILAS